MTQMTIPGLEKWRAAPEQVSARQSAQRLWDAIMAGDKTCALENVAN